MSQNKVLALLGLAARSRNVVSGEFMTEKAIKSGTAVLVMVSTDASENTRQLFQNKCSFYNVPIYAYGSMDELGHAMGKDMRASLAVLDHGLADSISKILDSGKNK